MVWWKETYGSSADFNNRHEYFIAFATSCLTAQPDFKHSDGNHYPSLGEKLVTCSEGGAVGYVGFTRIGVSEGVEQQTEFWKNLRQFGRLGPAALTPGCEVLWQVYQQVLYGDPEMPVWTELPQTYQVIYPPYVDRCQNSLAVSVLHDDKPLAGHHVTLVGNWPNGDPLPLIYQSKTTSAQGMVTFDLGNIPDAVEELTLTVAPPAHGGGIFMIGMPPPSRPNFKPFTTKIPVGDIQAGWQRCSKCEELFYDHGRGLCSADPAGHVKVSAEHYRLMANAVPPLEPFAESGWRWCQKCQSLFFAGESSDVGGVCKDQLPHDGTKSGKYHLTLYWPDHHDQMQWRRCDKCQVLYRADGAAGGACPVGDSHTSSDCVYVPLI